MLADAGQMDEAIQWIRKADDACHAGFRTIMKAQLENSTHAPLRQWAAKL